MLETEHQLTAGTRIDGPPFLPCSASQLPPSPSPSSRSFGSGFRRRQGRRTKQLNRADLRISGHFWGPFLAIDSSSILSFVAHYQIQFQRGSAHYHDTTMAAVPDPGIFGLPSY